MSSDQLRSIIEGQSFNPDVLPDHHIPEELVIDSGGTSKAHSLSFVEQSLKSQTTTSEDHKFRGFLQSSLDFTLLPIHKDYPLATQILHAYEYFEGVHEFIEGYFDLAEGELTLL